MKSTQKKILLLLLPVALFVTLRSVNWRRFHPAPTSWDSRCRTILLAADKIDVTLYTWKSDNTEGFAVEHKTQHIAYLKPDDMLDVVSYLNVTQECYPCIDGGMYCSPTLSLDFYKGAKILGGFTISDGEYSFSGTHATSSWRLHPTSARRLQEALEQRSDINDAVSGVVY